ncbi:MAG: hypothetical protein QUS09_11090, partial [Methanotrichaceae archaeon]|nr:hypothetical protein [Methanotrichaceae archaeon]
MRSIISLLILVVASCCTASADVSISRELYTNGGEVLEDLNLQGIDYKNDIYISDDTVYETADFTASSDQSTLKNRIHIYSLEGGFGAEVASVGEGLKGSRSLGAGIANFLSLGHDFSNGNLDASSYNGVTRGDEELEFDNGHYSSSIIVTPTAVFQSGAGIGPLIGDYDSTSVDHRLGLWYGGKYSNMDLQIDNDKDEGIRPAYYSWSASLGSQTGLLGFSQVAVGTSAGDSQIDVKISGTSSELSPKQISRHIYPLMLDESIQSEGDGGMFDDPDFNQMIDLLL